MAGSWFGQRHAAPLAFRPPKLGNPYKPVDTAAIKESSENDRKMRTRLVEAIKAEKAKRGDKTVEEGIRNMKIGDFDHRTKDRGDKDCQGAAAGESVWREQNGAREFDEGG